MSNPRLPATFVSLLVVGLLAGCGGGYGEEAATKPASGSFVSKLGSAPIGVAVVAGRPPAEGKARKVSVYVCDGRDISLWFTGQPPGNQVNLRSKGAEVRVTLTASRASGTIRLSDGRSHAFTAPVAKGVAGLYEVTAAASGLAEGTSKTGGKLVSWLGPRDELPWSGPVVATITAAGREVLVPASARRARPGAYRWIVLSNHKVYGASRQGPGAGGVGPTVPTDGTAEARRRRRPGLGAVGAAGRRVASCAELQEGMNEAAENCGKNIEGWCQQYHALEDAWRRLGCAAI